MIGNICRTWLAQSARLIAIRRNVEKAGLALAVITVVGVSANRPETVAFFWLTLT